MRNLDNINKVGRRIYEEKWPSQLLWNIVELVKDVSILFSACEHQTKDTTCTDTTRATIHPTKHNNSNKSSSQK